jgi:tRNA (guanine37-N1)-methyltransferase
MKFDVLTLFPEFFEGPLSTSVLGRAIQSGLVDVGLHDIRDHALGKHRSVDDSPYGGGAGMVMMAEPIVCTLESMAKNAQAPVARTILLSPAGRPFNQSIARALADRADEGSIVLICGRYEGIDCRVTQISCDDELSIGDYVLNGGELAALVIIEAVSRLIPGVLGNRWLSSRWKEGFWNILNTRVPGSFAGVRYRIYYWMAIMRRSRNGDMNSR